MSKRIFVFILCGVIIIVFFLLFYIVVVVEGEVVIVIDKINVRGGFGLSYEIKVEVKKGERYFIFKEEGDWVQF